jgi:hypothetical protein
MLFQPTLSAALTIVCFFFMIWPGYAVLHLMGFGRHRWPLAAFAGAPLTLAIWIIAISGAAWASIPLTKLSTPIVILMMLLAALGIVLRISVRDSIGIETSEERSRRRLLWLIVVSLPLLTMPSLFRFGLGVFAFSNYPDGWSYLAMADYLVHIPRGSEGGLSPLHQYASHMMNIRNASSALLAHLSMLFGVQADQTLTLYALLVLFANACALGTFAGTLFDRIRPATNFLLISGYAMPATVLYSANLDQLLLFPVLPLIAVVAIKGALDQAMPRSSILLGILVAAAIYAYIEMAFLATIVALSFIVLPSDRFQTSLVRVTIVTSIFTPVALLLTWPALLPLLAMLKSQFASAMAPVRPGEGFYSGAVMSLLCLTAISSGLIATGAWIERRRWAANAALAMVTALCLFFNFHEAYLYGAYKILSIGFWLYCFFAVVGGEFVISIFERRSWFARRELYNAMPSALFVALIAIFVVINEVGQNRNGLQQLSYREAAEFAETIGSSPTLISVRDNEANQWAVFYLSNMPTIVNPYRAYMAQPHVLPFMARTKPVEPASIAYIVTDHDDFRSSVKGAHLVRDGNAYSLWKVDGDDWTVTAAGGIYHDLVNLSGRGPVAKTQIAIDAISK